MDIAPQQHPPVEFERDPASYRHWQVSYDGAIARLRMCVDPEGGLRPGYELKLNSYDLGVDIELADVVRRLRFEHPEVRVVLLSSGTDNVFCAGANIHATWQTAAFLMLVASGYLLLFTAAAGQTPGKMLVGIRVVGAGTNGEGTEPLSPGQACLRELMAVPAVLMLGLGFLPALMGAERGLHDRIASTRVVRG